ncbi:MAG: hypothetical protein LZF60_420004 [Nitrospira sp.]|nr:MAG: hypothetical protein LZF60_420004 [Nitrospira sp.]
MLWVYSKDGAAPRKQSPKDTAAINHLYTTSAPGLAPDALEIAFGKQEGLVAPILAMWGERGAVPGIHNFNEISYFLALLHLRNPKTARWYERMAEVLSLERTKVLAEDTGKFDEFWEWLRTKEEIPPLLTKEILREKLLNADEHFTVKFDQKYITFSPLHYAECVREELLKMYWCLCTGPQNFAFITCDAPVVVRFRGKKGVGYGGGFGHPTATVVFPVSPNVCLYMSRNFKGKAIHVTAEFVKKMNRRMAFNAERNVYASERSAGIEKLVEKYSFTQSLPRIDAKEIKESFRNRKTQPNYPADET